MTIACGQLSCAPTWTCIAQPQSAVESSESQVWVSAGRARACVNPDANRQCRVGPPVSLWFVRLPHGLSAVLCGLPRGPDCPVGSAFGPAGLWPLLRSYCLVLVASLVTDESGHLEFGVFGSRSLLAGVYLAIYAATSY